jgi:hypothetical protein
MAGPVPISAHSSAWSKASSEQSASLHLLAKPLDLALQAQGKVIQIQSFLDPRRALEAAGLSE